MTDGGSTAPRDGGQPGTRAAGRPGRQQRPRLGALRRRGAWRSSPTSRRTTGRCRPRPARPRAITPWHRRLLLKAMERLDVIDAFMRARVAFLVAGRERGYYAPEQELELAGATLDTCRAAASVVDGAARRTAADRARVRGHVPRRAGHQPRAGRDAGAQGASQRRAESPTRQALASSLRLPSAHRLVLGSRRADPGRGHARRDVRPDHGVAGPRDHLGRGPLHPRRPRRHPRGRRAGLRPARAARLGRARAPLLGRPRWTAGRPAAEPAASRRAGAGRPAQRPAPRPAGSAPAGAASPPGRSSSSSSPSCARRRHHRRPSCVPSLIMRTTETLAKDLAVSANVRTSRWASSPTQPTTPGSIRRRAR